MTQLQFPVKRCVATRSEVSEARSFVVPASYISLAIIEFHELNACLPRQLLNQRSLSWHTREDKDKACFSQQLMHESSLRLKLA